MTTISEPTTALQLQPASSESSSGISPEQLASRPSLCGIVAKWTVIAGCIAALVKAAAVVTVPFQMNFGEGPLLDVALQIAKGRTAYPQPTVLPYMIHPYGPVGYYLFGLLVRFFGASFTPPRLLVLALTICCALLIGLLVRHSTGSRAVALLFGAFFLTMPTVQQWMVLTRVDMIGVLLSLAGLYSFVTHSRPSISVPFFVAALFCKFTFVAAPVACFLCMLSTRDRRKALFFAAASAGLTAGIVLLFQWSSGGWFLFHTVRAAQAHAFDSRAAITSLLSEARDNVLVIPLALWPFVVAFKKKLPTVLLLPLLFLAMSFLTTFARGKMGADSNYYLEWDAALCLCAGIGYACLSQRFANSAVARTVLPSIFICGVLANVGIADFYRFVHPQGYDLVLDCKNAYQYVRKEPGSLVLSDNIGAIVLAGKSPVVSEPFLWTREVAGAGWSDSEVVNLIRSHRIGLIVLAGAAKRMESYSSPRWPLAVLQAIDQNYKISSAFDCTDARYAYTPRGGP